MALTSNDLEYSLVGVSADGFESTPLLLPSPSREQTLPYEQHQHSKASTSNVSLLRNESFSDPPDPPSPSLMPSSAPIITPLPSKPVTNSFGSCNRSEASKLRQHASQARRGSSLPGGLVNFIKYV